MKMYKKSELTLINGLLVNKDGDVIAVNPTIAIEANTLETLAQKTDYLMAQPPASPMPTLDGFERQSTKDSVKFKTTTPIMDAKVQEAMDLMDELDDVTLVEKANSMLSEYSELIEFTKNDYVIDTGCPNVIEFDMPNFGSILELTTEQVCNVVALAAGMKPEGMTWIDDHDIEDADADKDELPGITIPLKDVETIEKFQDFLESVVKPDVQAKSDEPAQDTEATEE